MKRASSRDALDRSRNDLSRLFRETLLSYKHNLPAFGPELGLVSGVKATDAIVVHRLLKLFMDISKEGADERRTASIQAMLERNAASASFEPTMTDDVQWGKLRLHHWFRQYKPSYRFSQPSGASALPTQDEQDLVVKLSNVDNWEVSTTCFPYFFEIVWRNRGLKSIARKRFKELYPGCMYQWFRDKHGTLNTKLLFREQVRAIVTFNNCSRVTTVPKDNENDRVITCEPLLDMICQLSVMQDMRDHIKHTLGYEINTRAELHKSLIRHDVTTIDLSAASDFLSHVTVSKLWPPHMVKIFDMMRPQIFEDDGEYSVSHMFAPMGTGLTFDVMTLTLLAVLRFDKSASVFGDDIIVTNESYERALAALHAIGMVVNKTKSFTRSRFRESCGGMFHDEVGYINSYELLWPSDICKHIILVNKLTCLIASSQCSFELQGLLLRYRDDFAGMLPRDTFVGGTPEVSSSLITGLTGARRETNLTKLISSCLHRPITLARGYEYVNLASKRGRCQATVYNLFLLRGRDTPPLRTKTKIVTFWYDRDTRTRLTSFSLKAAIHV